MLFLLTSAGARAEFVRSVKSRIYREKVPEDSLPFYEKLIVPCFLKFRNVQ
jgi:hypothetical protein